MRQSQLVGRLPSNKGFSRETLMPNRDKNEQSRRWWSPILKDIHFWVPLIVLLAGLIVLRWIR